MRKIRSIRPCRGARAVEPLRLLCDAGREGRAHRRRDRRRGRRGRHAERRRGRGRRRHRRDHRLPRRQELLPLPEDQHLRPALLGHLLPPVEPRSVRRSPSVARVSPRARRRFRCLLNRRPLMYQRAPARARATNGPARGKRMQFETRRRRPHAAPGHHLGLGGATLGGNMDAVTDADGAHAGHRRLRHRHPLLRHRAVLRLRPLRAHGRRRTPRPRRLGAVDQGRPPAQAAAEAPGRRPTSGGTRSRSSRIFDYSYDAIMRSYEDSMQRLGLNRIDILYIHDIDVFTHGIKEQQEKVFRDGDGRGLQGARQAARAPARSRRSASASTRRKPIADAMKHGQWDVFLLAGRYTLLEQEPLHTLFPAVEKHGASIVIGGPFNSGILVGGKTWNYAKAPHGRRRQGQAHRQGLRRPQGAARRRRAAVSARPQAGRQRHPRPALGDRAEPDLRMVADADSGGVVARPEERGALDAAAPVPT